MDEQLKPAAASQTRPPIEGKTASGFAFSVPADVFDDMELVETLTAFDGGDVLSLKTALTMMLGADCVKELYAHLRAIHGKVPITALRDELWSIINAAPGGKN